MESSYLFRTFLVLRYCGAAVLRYSGDLQFAICNLPFCKFKALSLPKGDFEIVNRQSKIENERPQHGKTA
jgi:hypothetical protein